MIRRGLTLAAGLLLAQTLHGQGQVVIYRCTDARGAVTVQNDVACPKGSRQERRIIDVPPPLPAYRPAPPQPTPAQQTPPETVADVERQNALPPKSESDAERAPVERKPPPALFECRMREGDTYLSDSGEATRRCLPMQIVGVDGIVRNDTGEACEVVVDECKPVADDALCQAWDRRMREAEFRWKFARGSERERDARKADYDRYAKTYADSACAAAESPKDPAPSG